MFMVKTYAELLGKANNPDLLLNQNVSQAFKDSFLDIEPKFPEICFNNKILDFKYVSVYKIKNTKFLNENKINLKKFEKQLGDMLWTKVSLISESSEDGRTYFLEVYKKNTDNILLSDIESKKPYLDHLVIWEDKYGDVITLPMNSLSHTIITWITWTWKTNLIKSIMLQIINNTKTTHQSWYKILYQGLWNEVLEEINKYKSKLNVTDSIVEIKKIWERNIEELFENIEKEIENYLNTRKVTDKLFLFLDWFDIFSVEKENYEKLLDKIEYLMRIWRWYWISVICSSFFITSQILPWKITSNCSSYITFKLKSMINGDLLSKNIIWKEWAASIHDNYFWYARLNNYPNDLLYLKFPKSI